MVSMKGITSKTRQLEKLKFLSTVILIVALGLGLYTQWQVTENTAILIISLVGLLVFGISCALQFYFHYPYIGQILFHIWLGCILGIIIFSEEKEIQYMMPQEVMNILFITSLCVHCFWNVLQRALRLNNHIPSLCSKVEVLEGIGFAISTLITGNDAIAISLMMLAVSCNLVAIRLKSYLGLLNFIGLVCLACFVFYYDLNISVNIYGLACFVGRHAFEPIIDLYFSGLSTLERWESFFTLPRFWRHTVVLFIFLLNLVTGGIIGQLSGNHKEWFIVVPLFILFAILWLCFHFLSFITCWKLMSKISDCNLTFASLPDENKNMNQIMASKGVRHFSLISQRLVCITLVTTVVLMGIGWTTRTAYSLSLISILLPIECATLSLFWELGASLGGTVTGYAIIAPNTGHRMNTGATLLSGALVQDIGTRATASLNKMNQFFSHHMIDCYGCDYSTSGISLDNLESKVKAFFDRRTSDGPQFDTYIIYFSGETYDSGDWALTDGRSLSLQTLLDWWSSKRRDSGARLILIMDTENSYLWLTPVKRIYEEYVAIQTCRYNKAKDPESELAKVGHFTEDYVSYSLGEDLAQNWSDKERNVRAFYQVSRRWTDFTFHLPTTEEINNHWDTSFPKLLKPLVRAVNFGGVGNPCFCVGCVMRCLKRKKMKWLPPKELNTGHSFKLVRS
ncbi:transmembrane protein 168-like [Saccostrea echinata]|uniref:transmembrane protein 168-like n=1 Tax=Saccostrea echinata TaxID=191078 RepID=UPI002A80B817|nr:transmembrane protein 168-like [Saccostrea echinata]XP_061178953.1 transmembrane protein 168-like [Saccostrea echinata]